jgi:hypothetical protein
MPGPKQRRRDENTGGITNKAAGRARGRQHWDTVAALVAFARAMMPPDRPGSLSDQNYADVTAFPLDANGCPTGEKALHQTRARNRR